ncbi:MAG: hypothetical protein KDI14_18580, partial [Halioglobus sp.]|nr:hypothetical protein [Halioglobus sp.]
MQIFRLTVVPGHQSPGWQKLTRTSGARIKHAAYIDKRPVGARAAIRVLLLNYSLTQELNMGLHAWQTVHVMMELPPG